MEVDRAHVRGATEPELQGGDADLVCSIHR
jgi:hypothetical protein